MPKPYSYTAWASDELAGVYVLLQTRPKTIEIVNIAVKESLQNRGFGKLLVRDAIEVQIKPYHIPALNAVFKNVFIIMSDKKIMVDSLNAESAFLIE